MYSCPERCIRVDTISHIKICPEYAEERRNLSLENEKDMITYFRSILAKRRERQELEEERGDD